MDKAKRQPQPPPPDPKVEWYPGVSEQDYAAALKKAQQELKKEQSYHGVPKKKRRSGS